MEYKEMNTREKFIKEGEKLLISLAVSHDIQNIELLDCIDSIKWNIEETGIVNEEGYYICSTCKRRFFTPKGYKQHQRIGKCENTEVITWMKKKETKE
jgi:hypothetical protein